MTTPAATEREQMQDEANRREREALAKIEQMRARPPRFRDEQITMAHGAGGKATAALVRGLFLPIFTGGTATAEAAAASVAVASASAHSERTDSSAVAEDVGPSPLTTLDDAARLCLGGTELALTTDSFVVTPLQFPGGSIGELAVNGTVNDLAMAGARPVALTLALVLEEGLTSAILRREMEAVARAAAAAGVSVVAGDTKVVERGHADGMYICTTGVGVVDPRAALSPASILPGDRVLVSGRIGDHGTAIMVARGEFELDAPVMSDTRSLWPVADALLGAVGAGLRCMRDATRGGVASVLNELAVASGVAVLVHEGAIPVDPAVAGACEILGIDPLYVANEGKLVAVVAPEHAGRALAAIRAVPGCEDAAEIGVVHGEPAGMVLVQTAFGGRRVMDLLVGDPLPRIC